MRPVTISVTGAGVSAPVPMDTYISPFNVGIGCTVTGTATYTVQHTFDDVFAANYNPATGNWFNHTDLAGLAYSEDGNYAFPVRAIRLNLAGGSTGTVQMVLVEAGIGK